MRHLEYRLGFVLALGLLGPACGTTQGASEAGHGGALPGDGGSADGGGSLPGVEAGKVPDSGTAAVLVPATASSFIDSGGHVVVDNGDVWLDIPTGSTVFGYATPSAAAPRDVLLTDGRSLVAGDLSGSKVRWSGLAQAGEQLVGAGIVLDAKGGGWVAAADGAGPRTKQQLNNLVAGGGPFRMRGSVDWWSTDAPVVSAATCPAGAGTGCLNQGAAYVSWISGVRSGYAPLAPGAGSGQVAVDGVVYGRVGFTGDTDQLGVSGRVDGAGPIPFGATNPKTVSGPGVFVGALHLPADAGSGPIPALKVDWVQSFAVAGALPAIAPPTTSPLSDEPGYGANITLSEGRYLVTFSFTGTAHVPGRPDLVAPSGSSATALIALDAVTGDVLLARSFTKGAKSLGRPSHAKAYSQRVLVGSSTALRIVYVDTVWDEIAFDATHTVNTSSGGDVVVAVLDDQGAPLQTAQYGGAGDDEPLAFDGAIVYGRSNGPIDFGQGPLKPSVAGAHILWFADLSNLH